MVVIVDVDTGSAIQEPLVGHQLRCLSQGTLQGPARSIQRHESGLYHAERVRDGGGERDRVGGDEPAAQPSGSGVVAAPWRARGGT